jgi:hypothetical protein
MFGKMMNVTSCQLKEFLGLFLLILVIYLGYKIHQYRSMAGAIQENYEDYKTNVEEQNFNATPLSSTQKDEVKGIFKDMVPKSVSTYVNDNKDLLKGPVGPAGPIGMSGGTFIERGFLVNKSGSYSSTNKFYANPDSVLVRTSGNDPKTSLAFLDKFSPFSSYQRWSLNSSNQLMNDYDQSCVSMNENVGDKQKIYMSNCNDNSSLKFVKDKYSRMVVQDSIGTPTQKCLVLGTPENNILTSGLPDCISGSSDCFKVGFGKPYAKISQCDPAIPKDNEVWSFL